MEEEGRVEERGGTKEEGEGEMKGEWLGRRDGVEFIGGRRS